MKHKFFLYYITSIFLLRLLSFFTVLELFENVSLFKLSTRLLTDVLIVIWPLFLRKPKSIVKVVDRRFINLYLIFLGLAVVSLLYTSSFSVSFLQLLMYIESFLFSFFFLKLILRYQIWDPQIFFKVIMYSIFFITFAFFIGSIILPKVFFRFTYTDSMNRLGGYLMNPNELGLLIVIGLAQFIYMYGFKKIFVKPLRLITFVIALYALYSTFSRSSFIALLFVFIIYFSFKNYKKLIYAFVTFSIIPFVNFFQNLFSRGGNVEDVLTLTGRIPFWKDLINYVLPQEFLFGYGFQRIYYNDIYSGPNSYYAEMAHNTFLQLFLGLGLIGFLIGLILTISLFLKIKLIKKNGVRYAILSIFIAIVINSFTEFGIFGFYNFGVLFFQMLLLYLSMNVELGLKSSKNQFHVR